MAALALFKKLFPPGFFPWKTKDSCRPPTLVFSQFLEVLRANNRALEIIADIGEKLSGEYVFDRRYVDMVVSDLGRAMEDSVRAINVLTTDRCQELWRVLETLTQRVRAVAAGREDREGPKVLPLGDIGHEHWGVVGGKAAHLAEMIRTAQVEVPDGFVLTTVFFHELVDAAGLRKEFDRFEALLADPEADPEAVDRQRRLLRQGIQEASPPQGVFTLLEKAVERMGEGAAGDWLRLAVRSSAPEEDMDFSFAGQFHTELNVLPEPDAIFDAYLKVAASLFAAKAIRYRRQLFPEGGTVSIAVCCQRMIDSRASGVAYSSDPLRLGEPAAVVVAALGQGQAVVEGETPTDYFRVSKTMPPEILERVVVRKPYALALSPEGGLSRLAVSDGEAASPSITDEELIRLAEVAGRLESAFKRPQDIEWTVDREGKLYILQSRPLLIPESGRSDRPLAEKLAHYEVIVSGSGRVAQQGIGFGPVFRVEELADIDRFPQGAVLVAHRDSSQFVQIMDRAAAIVTEVGTPVSHMSTLCREFSVPCLVGVEGIMAKVKDGEEITVDAEDRCIYRGRVAELVSYQASTSMNVQMTPEFRRLRRILREVSRLHLVDPLLQEFSPSGCRTYHDLLRYIHETAVMELVNLGRDERCLLKEHLARRLDLPIPAGIIVIDLGGGLAPDAPADMVPFTAVRSRPFKAILQGMLFPDVWHKVAMQVGFRDMMSSMLSAPRDALTGQYTGNNIAIISETYVNLCFRFGYHFNIIDAFCHDVERDNHIYFRFLGGATDLAKRSRRAQLIATILRAFDFNVQAKGDLVIGRVSNVLPKEMERTLDILGRLIGFTRQLDVQMEDDKAVERYAEAFLMGDYTIVGRPAEAGKIKEANG